MTNGALLRAGRQALGGRISPSLVADTSLGSLGRVIPVCADRYRATECSLGGTSDAEWQ